MYSLQVCLFVHVCVYFCRFVKNLILPLNAKSRVTKEQQKRQIVEIATLF